MRSFLWFGLHLFVSNSGLGLAILGFTFLSSFMDKRTYIIVHRCTLLTLMLRNCIISPKSSCFKCGLWENGGNSLAPSSLLVSKNVRKKDPLKIENKRHLLFWHFLARSQLSVLRRFRRYSWCTHCAWNSFTAVHKNPASVPVCVHIY